MWRSGVAQQRAGPAGIPPLLRHTRPINDSIGGAETMNFSQINAGTIGTKLGFAEEPACAKYCPNLTFKQAR